MKKNKAVAIVLAAGRGSRMNSAREKQFLEIGGYPVLYYSLKAFEECEQIDEIVLVTSEPNLAYCREKIVARYDFHKIKKVVAGGKERYDSVYEGLKACEDAGYVLIHDGARPFLTQEIIERGLTCAIQNGACVIGMPSKDTVKIADQEGNIQETPDRNKVWIIQTPQIFEYEWIRAAYDCILKNQVQGITDDAMVAEYYSDRKIPLEKGSYENIKITTPEDLEVAETFLKKYKISC